MIAFKTFLRAALPFITFVSVSVSASSFSVEYDFGSGSYGCWPRSLMQSSDGRFYGETSGGYRNHTATVFAAYPGGGNQVGERFGGYPGGGIGLAETPDGLLWGTDGQTVYKMTKSGVRTIVHTFTPETMASGYSPYGGLVLGKDGWLYGTTFEGGSSGQGTAYRLRPTDGKHVLIGSFDQFINGTPPSYPLLVASNGRVYGTTMRGGDVGGYPHRIGSGTIFEVRAGIGIIVLHVFNNSTGSGGIGYEPSDPFGKLSEGSDGMLYGVTGRGARYGQGAIYRISKTGAGYQEIYYFKEDKLATPTGGLTLVRGGYLIGFGMQNFDGLFKDVIYAVSKVGRLSNVYVFGPSDGRDTFGEPVAASDGSIWGVTSGGYEGCGNVFRWAP